MDWETVGRVVVAAAPFLTALAGLVSRPQRARSDMKLDAEIAASLPDDSQAQIAVLRLVEEDAKALLRARDLKPDYSALVLALAGSLILGALAIWLVGLGSALSRTIAAPVVFLWLVFFFGIFESAQKKDRVAERAAREARRKARRNSRPTAH